MTTDIWTEWIVWAQDLLRALSLVTLGQVWRAIYNPPTPLNLSIAAVLIAFKLPEYWRRWQSYRLSRRVVSFQWPAPKEEADPVWVGRVIENPSIFSHENDDSLLPPETGSTGQSRKHITCFDPSTGYHLTTLPLRTKDEVAAQVQRAHDAQPRWAATSFAQRQMLMRSLKAWVLRDMEVILDVACRDTGKTRVDATFGEILVTLSKLDWLIKHGEQALSPQSRPTNLLLAHKVSKVYYRPLGTVLASVSWNYSFHNLISPILAALFSGNTIVLKCSEQVAWSSMWFAGGIRACLRACGLDEEVLQLVVALPEVAETLTRNPLIRHVTFIGSEPVGRKVALAAAEIMVPTCIELGGKDPAFLLPSVDLDFFASTLLRGAFQGAGQNCIGFERFLVPRHLQEKLIQLVLERVKTLRPGIDVGALISRAPIPRLEQIVADAAKSGARVLAGGKAYNHPDYSQAAYFTPTLVVDVTMDMELAQEEVFAPIMTVIPYDSVDEAIKLLNDSRYGLGAAVFGSDRAECRRVAQKLECGMLAVNDFVCSSLRTRCQADNQAVFYLNQGMPFGGVKGSGHGRFAGEEGLRGLCSTKSVTEDRFFQWIRTPIPRPVDFPIPRKEIYSGFLQGLLGVVYAESIFRRVRGLVQLVKASLQKP